MYGRADMDTVMKILEQEIEDWLWIFCECLLFGVM